jgi:hypothetical protein
MPEKQDLLEMFKINRGAAKSRRDAAFKRYGEAACEISGALRRAGVEPALVQDLQDASEEMSEALKAVSNQQQAEIDEAERSFKGKLEETREEVTAGWAEDAGKRAAKRYLRHLNLMVSAAFLIGVGVCAVGLWGADIYRHRGMHQVMVSPTCENVRGGQRCEFWQELPTEPEEAEAPPEPPQQQAKPTTGKKQ